jgi:hypothetical protein
VEASIDFQVVVDYNLVVSVRDSSTFDLQALASHQMETTRGTPVPTSHPHSFSM